MINAKDYPAIPDELDLLHELVPLGNQAVIELGCGEAKLARALLRRFPDCRVTGLEVDEIQHAKNLASPQAGLAFIAAGAQAIPFPDASFDLVLMLKSLHHVPLELMDQALSEVARVLRPGGCLYSSEPVYGGPLNDIVKIYNEEGEVRAAAQRALDRVLARGGLFEEAAQRRFAQPVSYRDFDDFAKKMLYNTYSDHQITPALLAKVRAAFEPHCGPGGAHLDRLMHVRLLRRR